MKILTHNLGLPRIGPKRELKKALESYWAEKSTESDLLAIAKAIRRQNWELQSSVGIDLIPSNDFSLYDHVLDTCTLVGAVPERFHWPGGTVDLRTYFAMARGSTKHQDACNHGAGHQGGAMEMTKWFDSNYHYIVPELSSGQTFELASTKPFDEWSEAKALGIQTVPVLLGPVSFLLLGKPAPDQKSDFDPLSLLPSLLSVYETTLQRLATLGAEWVQFDEPTLSL